MFFPLTKLALMETFRKPRSTRWNVWLPVGTKNLYHTGADIWTKSIKFFWRRRPAKHTSSYWTKEAQL